VGTKVGSLDGDAVGLTVGYGVGLPGKYVGENVGSFDGAAVGEVVGSNVGIFFT